MFGRYPSFIAANVILAIGGICLPLCNDTFCFASVRFVMGMNWSAFYGTMMVLGELSLVWSIHVSPHRNSNLFLIVLEYIPSNKRSVAPLTRALGTALSGAIIPSLLKALGDWKLFHQIIFAVPLFVLLTPLYVSINACLAIFNNFGINIYCTFSAMHESVRWLLARGKVDRAVEILAAISKTNGKSVSVDNLQQNIKVHNA